ncbi:unnamed protein product [Trichobilharzia regenti]|nr:unnamed protein product [Trichobilharzia regenti]
MTRCTRGGSRGPSGLVDNALGFETTGSGFEPLWEQHHSLRNAEYLLNKYSELPGEIMTFELPLSNLPVEAGHNKKMSLGLKLAGSRDLNQMSVFVCGIQPGSIIDRDGHIEVGDQLLEVSVDKLTSND